MAGLNPPSRSVAGIACRVLVSAMAAVGRDRRARRRRPRARRRPPLRRRLLARLRVYRHRGRAARPRNGAVGVVACRGPVRRAGVGGRHGPAVLATSRSTSSTSCRARSWSSPPPRSSRSGAGCAGGRRDRRLLAAATLATTPLLLAAIGGLVNRLGGLGQHRARGHDAARRRRSPCSSRPRPAAGRRRCWPPRGAGAVLGPALLARPSPGFDANEIIAGLGFNILVAGADRLRARMTAGPTSPPGLVALPRIDIPGWRTIPWLGDVLSGHDPLTYLAWPLVPADSPGSLASTRAPGCGCARPAPPQDAAHALGLATLRIRDASTVVGRRVRRARRRRISRSGSSASSTRA